MRLFYFKEGELSNFGDDINRWLWEELLPGYWSSQDEITFAGIGTIISRSIMPTATKWVVFSSGAGYAPPPADFGGPRWNVLAVRGPLTCRLLGLPPEKGVIDGAALLSTLKRFAPLPESERKGIVFMPHYESLRVGEWREVCRRSGFEFLDPHVDSNQVVERIRSAKLVLADAMHAAIVGGFASRSLDSARQLPADQLVEVAGLDSVSRRSLQAAHSTTQFALRSSQEQSSGMVRRAI